MAGGEVSAQACREAPQRYVDKERLTHLEASDLDLDIAYYQGRREQYYVLRDEVLRRYPTIRDAKAADAPEYHAAYLAAQEVARAGRRVRKTEREIIERQNEEQRALPCVVDDCCRELTTEQTPEPSGRLGRALSSLGRTFKALSELGNHVGNIQSLGRGLATAAVIGYGVVVGIGNLTSGEHDPHRLAVDWTMEHIAQEQAAEHDMAFESLEAAGFDFDTLESSSDVRSDPSAEEGDKQREWPAGREGGSMYRAPGSLHSDPLRLPSEWEACDAVEEDESAPDRAEDVESGSPEAAAQRALDLVAGAPMGATPEQWDRRRQGQARQAEVSHG